MSKGDSRDEFAKLVLKGVYRSAKRWDKISGEWLWYAPEYFITTIVAETLHSGLNKSWICPEASVASTVKSASDLPRRGRPIKVLSGTKRFDIVAYRLNGKPWAAVEIKHRIPSTRITLRKDMDRLAEAVLGVKNGSSLGLGCLVLYLECGVVLKKDESEKVRIERRRDEIWKWAKEYINDNPRYKNVISIAKNDGGVVVTNEGAYVGIVLTLVCRKRRG